MHHILSTSVIVLLLLVAAAPAHAQASRAERPYRGLFGSTDADVEQSLRVSGSLGGVFDTDLAAEALGTTSLGIAGSQGRQGGTAGQFSGSASYSLSKARVDLSANASSSGRYYPSEGGRILRRDNVGAQGSARLGLGLSVFASAGYRPFTPASMYSAFFAPGLGESSTDFDFGSSTEHYASYSGGVGWERQISRRASLNMSYRYAGRASSADVPQHRSQQAGGGLRYNLGRGLDLKLGYGYKEARYAAREPVTHQVIDAGVDYSRALSFSRRTTLSFGTGTSATDNPETGGGLRLRAVGNASLNHEIGRTWSASLAYSRSLRLDENWTEAIFSDAVMINLGGLVNRRFQVHARAGASTGKVSLQEDRGFDTYFGDTGINFALGRHFSVGTSYRYYHHQFAEGLSLASGIPPSLKRHSVQAYLSVWAPIFQRARRP